MVTSSSTRGWLNVKAQLRWIVAAFCLTAQSALWLAPAIATEPDTEMLEFLGTWETSNGEWVDPFELEETMTPPIQYRTRGETDSARELGQHENSDQGMGQGSTPDVPSMLPAKEVQEP